MMRAAHRRRWLDGLVLTGLVGVLVLPMHAHAQTDPTTPFNLGEDAEPRDLVVQVLEKFQAVAEALDQEAVPIPVEVVTRAVEASFPSLPDTDDRDWASSIDFNFTTELVRGKTLEPQTDGYVVLTDARDCVPTPMPDARIVYFRRFNIGTIRGHHCVVQKMSEEVWVLHSTTFAEGTDRRLLATYGMATLIDGDPEGSAAQGEAHLEANITLATAMADYGLALLTAQEVGPRRDPVESLRRLGEALGVDPATLSQQAAEPDQSLP